MSQTPLSHTHDAACQEAGCRDIAHLDRKEGRALTRQMRMIFQVPHASLNPHYTVGEILSEGMKLHRFLEEEAQLVPGPGDHYGKGYGKFSLIRLGSTHEQTIAAPERIEAAIRRHPQLFEC